VLDRVTQDLPQRATAVKDLSITIAGTASFIILVAPSGLRKIHHRNMIAGLDEISSGEFCAIAVSVFNEKAAQGPRHR